MSVLVLVNYYISGVSFVTMPMIGASESQRSQNVLSLAPRDGQLEGKHGTEGTMGVRGTVAAMATIIALAMQESALTESFAGFRPKVMIGR